MSTISDQLLGAAWSALALPSSALGGIEFADAGALPSFYPVSDLAAASVGAAALAVRELMLVQHAAAVPPGPVRVDRRLASLWFGWSIHPAGWERPALWDAVAGDYACADGWIRLHTNAIHHRDAALAVLGCAVDREAVARAVRTWAGAELEAAVVANGGCAAQMRSAEEWRAHPQGRAVAAEPLIALAMRPAPTAASWRAAAAGPERPLAGLKVLDLTRVLAGPVATRFLAGYGADVLRIDPPDWNEPGVIPEVTLGKRCARLDLHRPEQRQVFENLLAQADVLVHGYRADALDGLGYGEQWRRQRNPGLIDVSLDAYGWSGPLSARRGFDSLVQMSCGIAQHGMLASHAARPVPLPVQALDHATGYLMAAAVVRGVIARVTAQQATRARLSLARTAALLMAYPCDPEASALAPFSAADLAPQLEHTTWGPARRLRVPVHIDGAPMAWTRGASALGSAPADWPAAV